MIWQPLREDVAPLDVALSRQIRALILADPEGRAAPVWTPLPLPGAEAQLRLAARPEESEIRAGRMVLLYRLSGQATVGRDGFACNGRAVVDLKTRAFVEVSWQLQPLGESRGEAVASAR